MTRERDPQVARLLALPWTIRVSHDPADGYVARVDELPDAIATGDTAEELERDFWEAMKASIAARLELGEPVPEPAGTPVIPEPPRVVGVRRAADTTLTVAGGGLAFA